MDLQLKWYWITIGGEKYHVGGYTFRDAAQRALKIHRK